VRARTSLEYLFGDPEIQSFAGVNRFEEEVYFNKEGFLSLIWWLCVISLIRKPSGKDPAGDEYLRAADEIFLLGEWLSAFEKAAYRLHKLFDLIDGGQKAAAAAAPKKAAVKKARKKNPKAP